MLGNGANKLSADELQHAVSRYSRVLEVLKKRTARAGSLSNRVCQQGGAGVQAYDACTSGEQQDAQATRLHHNVEDVEGNLILWPPGQQPLPAAVADAPSTSQQPQQQHHTRQPSVLDSKPAQQQSQLRFPTIPAAGAPQVQRCSGHAHGAACVRPSGTSSRAAPGSGAGAVASSEDLTQPPPGWGQRLSRSAAAPSKAAAGVANPAAVGGKANALLPNVQQYQRVGLSDAPSCNAAQRTPVGCEAPPTCPASTGVQGKPLLSLSAVLNGPPSRPATPFSTQLTSQPVAASAPQQQGQSWRKRPHTQQLHPHPQPYQAAAAGGESKHPVAGQLVGQQAAAPPSEQVPTSPNQQEATTAGHALLESSPSIVAQDPELMQVDNATTGAGLQACNTTTAAAVPVPESQACNRAGAPRLAGSEGTQLVPATPVSEGVPPLSEGQQGPGLFQVLNARPGLQPVQENSWQAAPQPPAVEHGSFPQPVGGTLAQSQGTSATAPDSTVLAGGMSVQPVQSDCITGKKHNPTSQLQEPSPLPLAQPPAAVSPGIGGACNPAIEQHVKGEESDGGPPAHMMHEAHLPGPVAAMCCSPCGTLLATLMVEEPCSGTDSSSHATEQQARGSHSSKDRGQGGQAGEQPAGATQHLTTALLWSIDAPSKQLKHRGFLPLEGLQVDQQASQQVLAVMQPYRCLPCTPYTGARLADGSEPSWGPGLMHGCQTVGTAARTGTRHGQPPGFAVTPFTGALASGLSRHHTPLQPLLAFAGSLTGGCDPHCVSLTCLLQDGTWTQAEVLYTQMEVRCVVALPGEVLVAAGSQGQGCVWELDPAFATSRAVLGAHRLARATVAGQPLPDIVHLAVVPAPQPRWLVGAVAGGGGVAVWDLWTRAVLLTHTQPELQIQQLVPFDVLGELRREQQQRVRPAPTDTVLPHAGNGASRGDKLEAQQHGSDRSAPQPEHLTQEPRGAAQALPAVNGQEQRQAAQPPGTDVPSFQFPAPAVAAATPLPQGPGTASRPWAGWTSTRGAGACAVGRTPAPTPVQPAARLVAQQDCIVGPAPPVAPDAPPQTGLVSRGLPAQTPAPGTWGLPPAAGAATTSGWTTRGPGGSAWGAAAVYTGYGTGAGGGWGGTWTGGGGMSGLPPGVMSTGGVPFQAPVPEFLDPANPLLLMCIMRRQCTQSGSCDGKADGASGCDQASTSLHPVLLQHGPRTCVIRREIPHARGATALAARGAKVLMQLSDGNVALWDMVQGAILWVVHCPVQQDCEVQQRRVVLCSDHSACIAAGASMVLCSW